jgi:hypothetical protein
MDDRDARIDPSILDATEDTELPLDLRRVAERYATLPMPRPTEEATTRLLARLFVEDAADGPAATPARKHLLKTLRVARWRVRLLGAAFWSASVALLGLAAAITWHTHDQNGALPLILMAPLTAVLGIAFALHTRLPGLRQVEASCPTGVVEVTGGLVLAIVGFDCLFGVAATAWLALAHWAPFGALLAAWLGPLLLLSGVSVPIALRWGATTAAALGGGPWLALALLARLQPVGPFALPRDTPSLILHLAAAALGSVLLAWTLFAGSATPLIAPARSR